MANSSSIKINTQHFSPHDLRLFVESLETITRLTREKEERKEQEKLYKLNNVSKSCGTNLPGISSLSILYYSTVGDDEQLENRKLPRTPDSEKSEYDAAYFSAPNSTETSPRNSAIYKLQLRKNSSRSKCSIITTSDSDDSGIYPIGSDLPEPETSTMRSSSKFSTKFKFLSTKSRFLSMVRKEETKNVPAVVLISRRSLDEYETLEMYKQQLQQMLQASEKLVQQSEKFNRFSTLHIKKKSRRKFVCADNSSEARFLNKALRYLTL